VTITPAPLVLHHAGRAEPPPQSPGPQTCHRFAPLPLKPTVQCFPNPKQLPGSASGSPSWGACHPLSSGQSPTWLSHPTRSPGSLRCLAPSADTHGGSPAHRTIASQPAPPSPFAAHQPISSPETTSRSQPTLPPHHLLPFAQMPWSLSPRFPSRKACGLPADFCAPSARKAQPGCSPKRALCWLLDPGPSPAGDASAGGEPGRCLRSKSFTHGRARRACCCQSDDIFSSFSASSLSVLDITFFCFCAYSLNHFSLVLYL